MLHGDVLPNKKLVPAIRGCSLSGGMVCLAIAQGYLDEQKLLIICLAGYVDTLAECDVTIVLILLLLQVRLFTVYSVIRKN